MITEGAVTVGKLAQKGFGRTIDRANAAAAQTPAPTLPPRRPRRRLTTRPSASTTSFTRSVSSQRASTRRHISPTSRVRRAPGGGAGEAHLTTRPTGYLKAVKASLTEAGKSADEIKAFETGVSKYVKDKLLPAFKDLEFYTGESMNPDGMYDLLPSSPSRVENFAKSIPRVVLLNYREDGTTPYIIVWKHGLKEEKV